MRTRCGSCVMPVNRSWMGSNPHRPHRRRTPMAYDPATEAVMRWVLHELDPQPGDDTLSYEDTLRRLQTVLLAMVNTGAPPSATARQPGEGPAEATPEQQNAVTQGLARLHASADDHLVDHGTRLRRLQMVVDADCSRWTSAMVQPIGPSGYTAVPEPPPVE